MALSGAELLAAQVPSGLTRAAGHGYPGKLLTASHSGPGIAARTASSSVSHTEQFKGIFQTLAQMNP